MTSEAPATPPASPIALKLTQRPVDQELKTSFMDYAMSVIVSRALPDARDGLKPVHRRILYGMNELGITADKPTRKSARIVGDVLGKFHPHGESSVYDSLVRMAQDFSLRYPLIEGQGNFGSVDGDGAAAMRYTEARLSKVATEMLTDIEKETVDFVPNYDASMQEPTVLPSKLPNLLVNGSSGIAVGMATNMPPHNLTEVVDAAVHLIDHPDAHLNDLLQHIKGPDFPTGGIIMGRSGILEAFATGRGRIVVRGRVQQEKVRDRQALIVTELPYQVNKANLLVAMAELVKDKRVEGISDLRDESNREGMRVVIELKKDANVDVVLNQLYTHTALQQTFGVLNLALVKQKPVVMGLKRLLEEYVEHRVQIVTRRTQYDLRKAEERLHIVEGLLIALEHIDAVVALIRRAKDVDEARSNLIAKYALTDVQAKAILDMRLSKLAQLEVQTLQEEHASLLKAIARYKEILGSRAEVLSIIKAELVDLKQRFGDERRTEIAEAEAGEIVLEELIPQHDIVVTLTNAGYIKRTPLSVYRTQGRGGKGIIGTETKEEDFVTDVFVTNTHRYIMFFTTRGQVHWLKGYEIPEASRYGRGKAVVNLLQGLQPGERVTAAIPVEDFAPGRFVFFATKLGTVKRVELPDFKNVRSGGIRAIGLDEGDELIGVALTDGKQTIILTKASGKAVRFDENEVRAMGRAATGVRGIDLEPGTRGAVLEQDEVVALAHVAGDVGDLFTVKANGRGKRTPVADYPVKGRGTKGVITIDIEETVDGKTIQSPVVGMLHVAPDDEVIVSTKKGIVIRVQVSAIPSKGRSAQGNWIIRPEEGDRVVAIARVKAEADVLPGTPPA